MSATLVASPTSRLRFGLGRIDITPPVGIYKRLWGAARQERATGVHRPLTAEVMHLRAVDGSGQPFVRASLDLCGLTEPVYQRLAGALAEAAGVPRDRVSITFSHTHSAGWLFPPERFQMAGGDLLGPYLQHLEAQARAGRIDALIDAPLQVAQTSLQLRLLTVYRRAPPSRSRRRSDPARSANQPTPSPRPVRPTRRRTETFLTRPAEPPVGTLRAARSS